MRDLILAMSVSLDGFVSGIDGDISWIFSGDKEAKEWKVGHAQDAGLHIMGARTFTDMAGYWPTSTDVFAPAMNRIPKAVFTNRGPAILQAAAVGNELQPGGESWAAAYVAGGELAEEVAMLKAREGKPILAHGGAGFARSLIAAGLVDQYYLSISPIALGKGLPIFSDLSTPKRLKLIDSVVFPLGSISLTYRSA